jgi:pectate lyase
MAVKRRITLEFALATAALGLSIGIGCSEQRSRLITRTENVGGNPSGGHSGSESGNGGGSPVDLSKDWVAKINERPIGGASLEGGTQGGGLYESALRLGQVFVARSVEDIRDKVSGDSPAILLIEEGDYTFSGATTTLKVCERACPSAVPLAKETTVNKYCTNGEAVFDVDVDYEILRIGKNKTIVGLGNGAIFHNAEVDVSGSSNVILRNIAITDVSPTVIGSGEGLLLWPSDHIWVDHCTFRNIGRAFVNVVSSWDEENEQALVVESGFITFTNNHFDGWVDGGCGRRSTFVFSTSRNPGLTLANNFFERSNNRNGYFFGPGTWAHVFNNYWRDIDHSGLGVACGGVVLAQGNVFESTADGLYNNDDGVPTWKFCASGLFGKLYAPLTSSDDEVNLLLSGSTMSLHGKPVDGAGLMLPERILDHEFNVLVPVRDKTPASYHVTLLETPIMVTDTVGVKAGIGHLFK